MDSQSLKHNLLSVRHWLRLMFMLLFVGVVQVTLLLLWLVVVLQFLCAIVTGSDNTRLRIFGGQLAQYMAQIFRFLSYYSESKPFPFEDWPEGK